MRVAITFIRTGDPTKDISFVHNYARIVIDNLEGLVRCYTDITLHHPVCSYPLETLETIEVSRDDTNVV